MPPRPRTADTRRPGPAPAPLKGRSRPLWLVAAGLALLCLAVYANAFDAGFALDNKQLILNDPRVHAFGDEVVEDVEAEVVGCVVGALSAVGVGGFGVGEVAGELVFEFAGDVGDVFGGAVGAEVSGAVGGGPGAA